ncbi:MAG: hydrogenase maturation nickel metallochaperone HypA [Acidobacteria bacterium]|nr:hydrogenase maturation nickel metallochaperone HypA [Acidobacteriota bacterium]MBV9071158.1 hydrogenase maturation nickel metallochaperone HypA [Acidobacteriota bacterium]MBV9188389.1 hydrogenase maturation nickel metallochaperone HypA [Acidobacteriota bacterium]
MHEYSIVQSLVDSVAAAVGSREASVHEVHVAIGEMSGVDCGLLTTAYDVFRAGTLCEHASLTIERIPARWHCPRCDATIARGAFLRCIECNEPAQLASGDEIVLQRIELEVA